ncbi:GAF and ANTAR domain-containing protein [Microbacterium sp. 4R-513]|uniref:GAF and ANTAR domain-containing protein n=1 Tax=Microbacterium sp. 4R-513 TaxID=2567934 RepID=UPI001F49A9E8|nr:GAF and ANTAR domain-containing protein [Microbacterium sp. 4R-513]
MGQALPGDDRDAFVGAIRQLTEAGHPGADLCAPFVGAVGVTGAAISTLGAPFGSQTVCASSPVAARVDEIQIDLGEGPCWEALRTRRPVLQADLRGHSDERWPAASVALRQLDLGSLYAFPLFVGRLGVGSVDLYADVPRELSEEDVKDVTVLATIAARQVLRRTLDELGTVDEGVPGGPYSRRELHQASGMVAAQLGVGVDDALVVLRGHAFASDRSVLEVAGDVVRRRLVFET